MNTENLDAELAQLNAAVDAAIKARTAWMDAHMPDYAKFKIGDEIYERESGRLLGTVTKLYRFWGKRDPQYDTHMTIEYEYKTSCGEECFYDNTSRLGTYTPWHFATKDEVVEHKRQELKRMNR